ncbi:uncharacterized protein Tco025E_07156 [Trypanosoma conorhini]|uniref:Uncharacterized protein n=1 Tax=Trypanosoma conorhini TaxID=83891 RepID=A0A3R7MV20_9TRYP|nr:uncharacterized protein Tco025E_07156 [Trypanosoma conorhini]RNF08521.1 hypothetical protein Tco025E_07156 [Trypanosoma conorhini]
MLLRVRGNGASPENSQAALVYLRGFRRTNTRPPSGVYSLGGVARPLLYPHFQVGIETPAAAADAELQRHLRQVVWKELWNVYDIVYDELRLFPDAQPTAALLASSGSGPAEGVAGFTRLTARGGGEMAVVVTHHFPAGEVPPVAHDVPAPGPVAVVVVLDVSDLPLADAATRVAAEVAWLAGYASMQGALAHASHVVVRLPYTCDISTEGNRSPLVQEGLDFIGEHIALLAQSFARATGDCAPPSVETCFVGASAAQLQETLGRLCASTHAPSRTERGVPREGVRLFAGDQYPQQHSSQKMQVLQAIASAIGVDVSFEPVPLKSLLDGAEEPWDASTTRENQVLNFCPCCGHCGNH